MNGEVVAKAAPNAVVQSPGGLPRLWVLQPLWLILQTEQTRGMHHIIISGTREPQQTIACELSFYLNLRFVFLTIDQLTSHHGSPGRPQRGH
jgi:hypothetical protein